MIFTIRYDVILFYLDPLYQVLAFQRHFRCFPCAWFEPCRENVTVYHGPKEEGKGKGKGAASGSAGGEATDGTLG